MTTLATLTIEHLGAEATEADLINFQDAVMRLCELDGISEEEAIAELWDNGDWLWGVSLMLAPFAVKTSRGWTTANHPEPVLEWRENHSDGEAEWYQDGREIEEQEIRIFSGFQVLDESHPIWTDEQGREYIIRKCGMFDRRKRLAVTQLGNKPSARTM